MFGVILSISTPNNRGIHIYAKSIYDLIQKKSNSKLVYPKYLKKFKNYFKYFYQILWELKPANIKNESNLDFYISAYSRYPIDILLSSHKSNQKKILIVHDYMQCVKFKYLLSYKAIIKNIFKFEILRDIYHTILFRMSAAKTDYLIFNSHYTKQNFHLWASKDIDLNENSIVIHPLPSFKPQKVIKVSENLILRKSRFRENIQILFVTGKPSTKRSEMILPIIKELSNRLNKYKLIITIIGKYYPNKYELPLNVNLKIKTSVKEDSLIEEYLKTDIFMSTSSEEGFGIPLLDAITFNIPTIASSIPAYNEIYDVYKSESLFLISSKSKVEDFAKVATALINKGITNKDPNKAKLYHEKYLKIYKKSEERLNSFLKDKLYF